MVDSSPAFIDKSRGTDKLPDSCMQWSIRSSLFGILVVQDFQKFLKSLKPLCRSFRQALAVGKQLCGFVFLSRQIEAAGMLVHAVKCVWFFPDHCFHRRHYSLHLARVGADFIDGGLRVFCCFFISILDNDIGLFRWLEMYR